MVEKLISLAALLIGIAFLLALFRFVRGPHAANRVVAFDVLTIISISGIVLAALIYGFFVIKKDDQEVGGDPFYTDKQLKAQAAAEANA